NDNSAPPARNPKATRAASARVRPRHHETTAPPTQIVRRSTATRAPAEAGRHNGRSSESERRRPSAAPVSRPTAGIAATTRTRGHLQKAHQDPPRRHEGTKSMKPNDLRVFVTSWLTEK